MRAKFLLLFISTQLCPIQVISFAKAEEAQRTLSLSEVLHQAENTNPELKASELQRIQTDFEVSIVRSALLPHLDLSAVDSWGMAGSSSPTPPQFGGLMGSPFRMGASAGLLGKYTVFDLAGIRAVREAQENAHSSSEQTRLDRTHIYQTSLQLYFQVAEFRSEWKAWQEMVEDFEPVINHVKQFVRNGQYSDVQRLLLVHQLDNAKMQRDVAEGHYRANLERLKIFVGIREREVDCPSISKMNENTLKVIVPGSSSPLVTHAESRARTAEFRASKFSADLLPKVYTLGSIGFLENSQLAGSQNYSAWIGITFPIFEGFRISSEIHQAEAQVEQQHELVSSARLALEDLNIRYQEIISTSKLQILYLEKERDASLEGFKLALQRYFAFVEPLSNLIQAMNDLNQVKLQLNHAQAQLLSAKGTKLLINGGTLQ